MRGSVTFHILKTLGSGIVESARVFDTIITAGYGASYGKMEYVHRTKNKDVLTKQLLQQRYYTMLTALKRDGLITTHKEREGTQISITDKGKKILASLLQKRKYTLPYRKYPITKEHTITIITFDIPEQQRRKRDWLRAVLKNIGLHMIHKSVWIGKNKIPKEFLDDLLKLRMNSYVEIFEVTKTGTLTHVS